MYQGIGLTPLFKAGYSSSSYRLGNKEKVDSESLTPNHLKYIVMERGTMHVEYVVLMRLSSVRLHGAYATLLMPGEYL